MTKLAQSDLKPEKDYEEISGRDMIVALYTKPGFPEALKQLEDAAEQTGFKGEKIDQIKMFFFSIFAQEVLGLDPLKEYGIDRASILPEIKEKEIEYKGYFLDGMLNDEELWSVASLRGLQEANIRSVFSDIDNQTDIEKLILKMKNA